MNKFEKDMMTFINDKLAYPYIEYPCSNIDIAYYVMEKFEQRIKKHPLIFN